MKKITAVILLAFPLLSGNVDDSSDVVEMGDQVYLEEVKVFCDEGEVGPGVVGEGGGVELSREEQERLAGWAALCGVHQGSQGQVPQWCQTPVGQVAPPQVINWHKRVTMAQVAQVAIHGSGIQMQPDQGWVLIKLETIVTTSNAPQEHQVQVLGRPINIKVTPINFHYDFGDGQSLDTRDPGRLYPDHTTFVRYQETAPARQITLTTTWTAQFEHPVTGTWHPIDGTLQTTDKTGVFEVLRLQSVIGTRPPEPQNAWDVIHQQNTQ
ncbi:hypothetical protein [Buchananella hordeovulneris]|nr:hypothetical protein [Buchananella hordeovulneris]